MVQLHLSSGGCCLALVDALEQRNDRGSTAKPQKAGRFSVERCFSLFQEDRLQQQMQKEYEQYGATQQAQPGYAPGYYASPQSGYGAPAAPGAPGAPGYGAGYGMPAHWGQAQGAGPGPHYGAQM